MLPFWAVGDLQRGEMSEKPPGGTSSDRVKTKTLRTIKYIIAEKILAVKWICDIYGLKDSEKERLVFCVRNAPGLRGIFNLAGVVMPALLIDGKVAGKWKKKDKRLVVTTFKSAARQEKDIIADFAA